MCQSLLRKRYLQNRSDESRISTTAADPWYLKVKDTDQDIKLQPKIIASLSACKKSARFLNSFLRFEGLMN